MKNIIISLLAIFAVNQASAQALEKGDFDIHVGLGFGIYSVTSNDFEDDNSAGVPGLFSVGIAYQLSDKWSLGLKYERMGFLTEADSNHKAVSNNFGVVVAYNFINAEKDILNASFETGYSSFRYDDFKDQAYVIGSGPEFQLSATWKHYFGEKFGMYMNMSVPYFYYTNFKNGEDDKLKVASYDSQGNLIEERLFSVSMVGVNFRVGLLLKL